MKMKKMKKKEFSSRLSLRTIYLKAKLDFLIKKWYQNSNWKLRSRRSKKNSNKKMSSKWNF